MPALISLEGETLIPTGDGSDPVTTAEERRQLATGPDPDERVACPRVNCLGGIVIDDRLLLAEPVEKTCDLCEGAGSVGLTELPPRPKTILAAERFNQRESGPQTRAHFIERTDRWYQTSLHVGNFLRGPSRGKLRSIGLSWDLSLNLTLPAPQGVKFDQDQAMDVAEYLLRTSACELLLMCGQRVTECVCGDPLLPLFKVAAIVVDFPTHVRWMVRIPHPSGLNRWWNGADLAADARCNLVPRLYEDAHRVH